MTIKPMLASPTFLTIEDFAQYTPGEWFYEPKYDGIRCIAHEGRLWSRAGNDISDRFPEIKVPSNLTLDGEIVITDEYGYVEFSLVAKRTAKNADSTQAEYRVFDLPMSKDLYIERSLAIHRMDLPDNCFPVPRDILVKDAWQDAHNGCHEGIIAKRRGGLYVPGSRSKSWLKIKKSSRLSAIVVGATKGAGKRSGYFGALELALLDTNNQPVRIGEVGTGFNDNDLAHITGLLALGQPFVIDVEFMEVTAAKQLRFPSYKGVRDDLSVLDCKVEQLQHK